ncbi:MAG: hypothetical protein WBA97_34550 [Actinophytocola sp.]
MKITTPGPQTDPPTVDPETGNEVLPPPVTRSGMAWMAQRPTGVLAAAAELNAGQNTTISLATILVPIGTVLTKDSTVEDVDGVVGGEPGAKYVVEGKPADRYSGARHQKVFRAAALRLISDLQ